jgi:molybdopterin synthase catalytic subunit
MRIRDRGFAVVRERLRRDGEEIQAPPGATVGAVLDDLARRHEAVARLRPWLRVAVNRAFAPDDHALADGDELALIPPVAGGAGRHLVILAEPLDPARALGAVAGPDAGGVALFVGIVRDTSEGRRVVSLHYEAYAEMAGAVLAAIADEAARRWPGCRVAVEHRVGTLAVGETAVVVAAAAPHRAEAFAACRFAIDAVKERAPIWKKETGPEGETWVGCGG